ncbi:MAG TPA: hypothetical protein PLK75_00340 [Bacteroidales bacterium]|nr:hypothetical protein [Bacteroidales bacterium]
MRYTFFQSFCVVSLIAVVMISCGGNDDTKLNVVARVGEKQLLQEDLEFLIPNSFSKEDSLKFAESYINDWVFEQLLYAEALNSITDTASINKQLEEYRQSLYNYYFERQLLESKIDTVVGHAQISEYYSQHLYEYVLDQPVIKLHSLVFDANKIDYIAEVRMIKNTEIDEIESLFEFCERVGGNIMLIDRWIRMSDFYRIFPCEGNLTLEKIEKGGYYECFNDSLRYLIIIDDIIPVGSYCPQEVLTDDIRKIILQKRSKDFMSIYKKQLFIQAENSGRLFIKNKKNED